MLRRRCRRRAEPCRERRSSNWRRTDHSASAHSGARRAARTGLDCANVRRRSSCAWLSPHARRRWSEHRLQFAAGGPAPLTEDRQKPNGRQCDVREFRRQPRLDGRHGTRNTVPSRALTGAVEGAHCRPQRRSWVGHRVTRPEQLEFAEGMVPVLAVARQ